MRKLMTLINREFWEQKGVFFKTPMVLSVVFIVVAVCFCAMSLTAHLTLDGLSLHTSSWDLSSVVPTIFSAIGAPFMIVLWVIVFYYFLGSLYDDRKDGSVLFWQSMPVTQTQTIISKLVAGFILAPFCSWVILMVTQLIVLCILSLYLMIDPVVSWTVLWYPGAMLAAWAKIFGVLMLQGVWLLPLLAWCMLCSAFSKKAPALRALVPVVLLLIVEAIFLKVHFLWDFIASRFALASSAWFHLSSNFQNMLGRHDVNLHFSSGIHSSTALTPLIWVNVLVGVVVALICFIIAGWFRSKCYDFDR